MDVPKTCEKVENEEIESVLDENRAESEDELAVQLGKC